MTLKYFWSSDPDRRAEPDDHHRGQNSPLPMASKIACDEIAADSNPNFVSTGSEEKKAPLDEVATGVQNEAERVTLPWSRNEIMLAYCFMLLVYLVNFFNLVIIYTLNPYVTSNFDLHALVAVINIIANVVGGLVSLPTSKILDRWGRAEGVAAMIFLDTLGIVLCAVCTNVQTYAAAQVFFNVGFQGVTYVLSVVVADTTSLKNRGIVLSLTYWPLIVASFAGPAAAQSFYYTAGWRWCFGCFAILTPVLSFPITLQLYLRQRKKNKLGKTKFVVKERTVLQFLGHYFIEFDIIGGVLLCAGLNLFLLPFSLAYAQEKKWKSPMIIGMITSGIVIIILYGLWERYVARTPFIPYRLLRNPTVGGAFLAALAFFTQFYAWYGYYTSFLMVVYNMGVARAGYISQIYGIGSCVWMVIVGILIRWSKAIKWLAVLGLPVLTLGSALMIVYNGPDVGLAAILAPQILIALGGGTITITTNMVVMTVADAADVANVLALIFLATLLGYAVGSSISGAIWTNTFSRDLQKFLPAEAQADFAHIYGNIETQLSYAYGEPIRNAIVKAYGQTQMKMCLAGTVILVLSFVGVAMWKNNMKVQEQLEGDAAIGERINLDEAA